MTRGAAEGLPRNLPGGWRQCLPGLPGSEALRHPKGRPLNAKRRRQQRRLLFLSTLSVIVETRYEGRETCLAFWKGVASSDNLVFKAEEISAMGDRGIIRWQLRWSNREADRGRDVNIMRVRDGKIVEGLGYVKGG